MARARAATRDECETVVHSAFSYSKLTSGFRFAYGFIGLSLNEGNIICQFITLFKTVSVGDKPVFALGILRLLANEFPIFLMAFLSFLQFWT